MAANNFQVGGTHYKNQPIEHWDVVALHDLDYFQGQITKYVMRWKSKNGLEDLRKADHFLEKYIEIETLRKDGRLTSAILLAAIKKLEDMVAKEEQRDHAASLADEAQRCGSCGHMPPMHAGNCTAQR